MEAGGVGSNRLKYVRGFDGIRAIAVILVLIAHLQVFKDLPKNLHKYLWSLTVGTSGVYIFFTLSGFLISNLLLTEKFRTGSISLKNFFIRRILRLSPPLFMFLLVVGILMNQNMIRSTVEGFVFSALYLYNFVPKQFYTGVLGSTWSLGVEEQFYLFWPLVIKFYDRNSVFLTSIILIILSYLAFDFLSQVPLIRKTFHYHRWFLPAIGPIIIGALFSCHDFYFKEYYERYIPGNKLVLLSGISIFVLSLLIPSARLNAMFIIHSVGISILLIWIKYNQASLLVNALDIAPVRYTGKISYGLYVWQGLFITTGGTGPLAIQKFPVNLILTVAVTILSFHLVEKPILQLKDKFR